MYLHEYQAKMLLARFGVNVLPHFVMHSLEALDEYLQEKQLTEAVLKVQVHSGGRGKAGGIIHAKTPQEIRESAKKLLGMKIVNAQTGPEGLVSSTLLVDTPVAFQKEYYIAVVLDRNKGGATVICSKEGGVEIEEVAKNRPSEILVELVPDSKKLYRFQLLRIIDFLALGPYQKEAIEVINGCVEAFFSLDALLIEINPLVLTKENRLIALDAKVQIDDNALFRQPELEMLFDATQLSKAEREAKKQDLAYVHLEGTIGCIVNGAGLAMATMDLIHYSGGEPANFLDVGGGASRDMVVEGFKLLFLDTRVKAILVNIFGGIMNCEIIARALLEVTQEMTKVIPVVVRMEGTNVQAARELLVNAPKYIYSADSLDAAAKLVVELANGHSR